MAVSVATEGLPAVIKALASLVDDAERALLFEQAELRHVRSGDALVLIGEPDDALLVVSEGTLAAEIPSTQGPPVVVDRYGPGDFFCEMSLLRGDPAAASVRAISDCAVWAIPHALLRTLIARHPEITQVIALEVARKLSATNRHLGELPLAPGVVLRSSGTEWSETVVSRVVGEIARHAKRPILYIGDSPPAGVDGVHELPSLSQLTEGDASVADFDSFLRSTDPAVGFVEFSPHAAHARSWRQLLRNVRRSSSPAVVSAWGNVELLPFEDPMTSILIIEESKFASGPVANAHQTVLLRAGRTPVRPG